MYNTLLWMAIAAGLAAAVFLIKHNLTNWRKLKSLKAEQAEIQTQQTSALKQSHMKASDSIRHIAKFVVEEQAELSECCIRIKVLLDHVAPDYHEDPRFSIFNKMYDATAHMPTHQARKDTDKKQIKQLDEERFQLEAAHKEEIIEASQTLLSQTFN